MSKTTIDDVRKQLDELERNFERAIREARLEGFQDGLMHEYKPPTEEKFREDHKEPMEYGEDWLTVVYAENAEEAAKLLETEAEYVDEVGIGWGAFEVDGELQVGYKAGKNVTALWSAYGVWH